MHLGIIYIFVGISSQAYYIKDIVRGGVAKGMLDPNNADASYENNKKGFMFYLNASGTYLVLREHLRAAFNDIVQQKCLASNPSGFKTQRSFQVKCIFHVIFR
jgi:hypothetical protein